MLSTNISNYYLLSALHHHHWNCVKKIENTHSKVQILFVWVAHISKSIIYIYSYIFRFDFFIQNTFHILNEYFENRTYNINANIHCNTLQSKVLFYDYELNTFIVAYYPYLWDIIQANIYNYNIVLCFLHKLYCYHILNTMWFLLQRICLQPNMNCGVNIIRSLAITSKILDTSKAHRNVKICVYKSDWNQIVSLNTEAKTKL